MQKEFESLEENQVWDLVELPKDRRVVGSKWVFKRKIGENGKVERYKARLVAQGYSQKFNMNHARKNASRYVNKRIVTREVRETEKYDRNDEYRLC
uniref:Reverse transcriptase Ty1/copia-type domain-containing protein n=1 Tax=Amphimedon queenslandica TaxID=400682 RepID=A0A1X7TFD5_AMPQE